MRDIRRAIRLTILAVTAFSAAGGLWVALTPGDPMLRLAGLMSVSLMAQVSTMKWR